MVVYVIIRSYVQLKFCVELHFSQRSVQKSTKFFITGHQQVRRLVQNSGSENCAELQSFDFPDVESFCPFQAYNNIEFCNTTAELVKHLFQNIVCLFPERTVFAKKFLYTYVP